MGPARQWLQHHLLRALPCVRLRHRQLVRSDPLLSGLRCLATFVWLNLIWKDYGLEQTWIAINLIRLLTHLHAFELAGGVLPKLDRPLIELRESMQKEA